MDEDLYGFKPAHKGGRRWLRVLSIVLAIVVIVAIAVAVMVAGAWLGTRLFIELVT